MVVKDWRNVKDKIEDEIDKIWFEEPKEVRMSRLGIFPSGAGTDGQILGNLFFLVADTQAMSWWTVKPGMQSVIADPSFTLEHCKKTFKYFCYHMAGLMGEVDPPNCPAPWLNLPKLWQFCKDIINSYDTIKNKEDFASLIWSWNTYAHRLNKWFCLIFPWHLGKEFPRMEPSHVKELAELMELKIGE